jgi:hypothetical protein
MITFGIVLGDGTEHVFTRSKLPRKWKSWVLHQLPYSTSVFNCSWINPHTN